MFNEKSIKVPSRQVPTHQVVADALFFIPENNFRFDKQNKLNQAPTIQRGSEITINEYGLGYEDKWAKVTYNDTVGYIIYSGSVEPLKTYGDFYPVNTDKKYSPSPSDPEINWKTQKPNIAYEDNKNGVYAVHCELEDIIVVGDSYALAGHMDDARKKAIKIILDHVGYKYSESSINQLLNYYLFCSAEEWYVDPRPCSTLRVLVVIPKRFIYAKNDLLQDAKGTAQITPPATTPITPPDYFTLTFNNYQEYKYFFGKLIETLEKYNTAFMTRKWTVDPQDVRIDFLLESNNVKKFVESTNQLIATNQPETVKVVTDVLGNSELVWDKSLDIVIDKKTLSIKEVKYYSSGKRYLLGGTLLSYLRSDEVTNQTTVNYCLVFNPAKDAYGANPPDAAEITGAALTGGLSLLMRVASEDDINKFLKEKHYPKVNSVTASPVDLFECTIDTVRRVEDLASIKLPLEINKWKALNAAYEQQKMNIEGDLFIRSLQMRDFVQDRNMRILLGIDTLAGKTEKEKLAIYLSIARSIDWAKFLSFSVQCFSRALTPEELLALMKKYKEARKFIEQVFLSTVCNPFLKNGLKVINGFELPVIRAYNPNEVLARELEAAYIKIMKDLVSIGIKKALEAAAKACTSNPNNNFNSSGGFTNPLADASSAEDPALSDLLDEVAKASNLDSSPESKESARQAVKNILEDVSSCLSLKEMCQLYNGTSVNDEVYQIIISLVKRKYGSPYSEIFATRDQIIRFFRTLGGNMDLSICADLQPETPGTGANILCDDGKIYSVRKKILEDHGLTPDLIDQALQSIKDDETKALEDVLKLLNSDNPFDFSQVPDLGCKVFPSGETIAPSMQSFSNMLNSMLRSVYDSFDREAQDWYKTTYSSYNPSKPQFLTYNQNTHEIEPVKDIKVDPNVGKSIQDGSGSANEEIKLPSYMFKNALSSPQSASLNYINASDGSYMLYSSHLNGDLQQKLDLQLIESDFKQQIQLGETLLSNFAQLIWSSVATRLSLDLAGVAIAAAGDPVFDRVVSNNSFKDIDYLLYAFDSFIKSNPTDAEVLRYKLKDAYKVLGVTSAQEANGFFAAENGAALYLIICEQLGDVQTRTALNNVISLSSYASSINPLITNANYIDTNELTLSQLLDKVLQQYNIVKDYYRTIVKLKINYPDYDLNYQTGLDKVSFGNTSIHSYISGSLYDIQKVEVQRNKINYIKLTEINKLADSTQTFITDNLNIDITENQTKEKIFAEYVKKKAKDYGFYNSGMSQKVTIDIENFLVGDAPYSSLYEQINQRIYKSMSDNILSRSNKFLYLKDLNSSEVTSIAESGSGQPYTQYLKLVIPQTPQQKNCGIRPHYLDIDLIKDQIINEKANNLCVEKIVDDRVVGNQPINIEELKDIENSSTQKTMLRGTYRLATRTFLHDLLLRSIGIFSYYDPQSLRDEPAFITFMAKMAESEMRGMDNSFFTIFSEFLLKSYMELNPNQVIVNVEVKKSQLFRDLVEQELKDYVLPKLAKRINADTNLALISNRPKDNPIKLVKAFEDASNNNIIFAKGNSVYLKINFYYNSLQEDFYLKIYSAGNSGDSEQTMLKFIGTEEYKFLFNYIFPVSQTLNNFFMLNCLATTTRKQVVSAFRGTKRDIMATCKIIQSNGQDVAQNPNDAQGSAIDPIEIIIGFLIQAAIKTPIGIIKGVAEGSEPNIALVSTGFKFARTLAPNLSSFLIPAVSLPLGLIPAPVIPLLPFANPLLTFAYFGTLAWYDDSSTEDAANGAAAELERNLLKGNIKCGENVYNQDSYYLDRVTPITVGNYNTSNDQISQAVEELTPEQVAARRLEIQSQKTIDRIVEEVKLKPYSYPDPKNPASTITNPISFYITNDSNIRTLATNSVKRVEATIGGDYKLTPLDTLNYLKNYQKALDDTENAAKAFINNILDPPVKENTQEKETRDTGPKNNPSGRTGNNN